MPDENDALREQFLVLLVAAPLPDYSLDSVAACRLGNLLAQQTHDRALLRLIQLAAN